jgi:hypothetical protein
MKKFFNDRPASMTTVVFILLMTLLLQSRISYGLTFGSLAPFLTTLRPLPVQAIWISLRALSIVIVLLLWILNRRDELLKGIVIANGFLTLGLVMSTYSMINVLIGFSSDEITIILVDVVLMASSNVLIFSIWYWLMDPPGISTPSPQDEAWDFLFPQRANELPFYDSWVPSYTDYFYLAFSATLAFSPAVTLPLSKRAKWVMMVQTSISAVTIIVIAGTAISALASI